MTKRTKSGAAGPGTPAPAFRPFADDASVQTFGALTFENGSTRIALHGSTEITRDRAGLARARQLRDLLAAIASALEGADLPETVTETAEAPEVVRNPFA